MCLSPDVDDLVERLPLGAVLAPDVRDVASTHRGGDLRELDDFLAR
jgi:hypothetical protein